MSKTAWEKVTTVYLKDLEQKKRAIALRQLGIQILATIAISMTGMCILQFWFESSDRPETPRPITQSSITTPRIVAPTTVGGGGKMSELKEKCKAAGLC